MNKRIRTAAACLVAVFTLSEARAQFETENLSFGAGLGYTGYAGLGGGLALHARGNYNLDENSSVVLGYSFLLPFTEKDEANAHAFSSSTNPSNVPVSVEASLLLQNIFLNYHRYLVGDNEESFGLYGLAGVGLTFASVSYTVGSYDKTLYTFGTNDAYEPVSASGFIIDLGLGSNINISDKMALFGEFKIGWPAGNSYNSRTGGNIENPIPFCYGLAVGLRFSPFN